MSYLFEGAESQFIDEKGKTRLLNYTNSITLITSPLPPLNIKMIVVEKREDIPIQEANFNTVLNFVKDKELEITAKDGNPDEGIQGVWIKPKNMNVGITNGYIPLSPMKAPDALNKVKYVEVDQNDPIRTDGKEYSLLDNFRKYKKIADILKIYTLYTYSLDGELDKDGFVIDSDHVYDIVKLNKRLYRDDNDIMYRNGKLIVDSEETRDKLLYYLKVELLNDTPGVENLSKERKIPKYYKSISDFKSRPSNVIFTGNQGLERWIDNKKRVSLDLRVAQYLIPEIIEPYFYRSLDIKQNQLMIIQNVDEGDLERAKTVSMKWMKDRVNIGYYAEISNVVGDTEYVVYSENKKTKGKKGAPVIQYEDGSYGAILFLG